MPCCCNVPHTWPVNVWGQTGRDLVRVKGLVGVAVSHAIANKAHLGWAVNLVQDQPGVIAAQVILHVLLHLEPAMHSHTSADAYLALSGQALHAQSLHNKQTRFTQQAGYSYVDRVGHVQQGSRQPVLLVCYVCYTSR